MSENSIEFSLSNSKQRDSWLNSGHWTLDADINDFNLRTKELGCSYWSTYTKSGIGGVQVTSLHYDPIGVDNRSLGAKN